MERMKMIRISFSKGMSIFFRASQKKVPGESAGCMNHTGIYHT